MATGIPGDLQMRHIGSSKRQRTNGPTEPLGWASLALVLAAIPALVFPLVALVLAVLAFVLGCGAVSLGLHAARTMSGDWPSFEAKKSNLTGVVIGRLTC